MFQTTQTFLFKKYISNGWYFLKSPIKGDHVPTMKANGNSKCGYFVPSEGIALDHRFKSASAKMYDAGFRAFNQGILLESDYKSIQTNPDSVPLEDEYRFLRKFNKRFWVYFVLLYRVITFHNPFKELFAFIKSRDMGKADGPLQMADQSSIFNFNSELVRSNPKVTVIIPTLNRYNHLYNAIKDIENQTITIHELIVVDQSDEPDVAFYNQFQIPIQLIIQKEKGQWLARNEAIRRSTGDWLLFFDDDSRVEPHWVAHHLKAVDFFNAEISAGVSLSKVGDKIPENYSFYRWADQFDSGNALVHKKVFETIGMFDRQYDRMRMGDGEFGMRSYLNGFRSISNPEALRIHLKVSEGGLRQVGSWDAFRTKKWFAPIPIPSVSFFYLTYFDKASLRYLFFQNFISAAIPYKFKGRKELFPIFVLWGILKLPISVINFKQSLRAAQIMLQQGPMIDQL